MQEYSDADLFLSYFDKNLKNKDSSFIIETIDQFSIAKKEEMSKEKDNNLAFAKKQNLTNKNEKNILNNKIDNLKNIIRSDTNYNSKILFVFLIF